MSEKANNQNIEKIIQVCNVQERNVKELREESRCKCLHQKKGAIALVKKGGTMFTCKLCHKDNINLDKSVLNVEELRKNIEAIDQAMDILKMNLKLENEADNKTYKRLWKAQFFLRFRMIPLIESISKKNNKGDKKNHQQESSWSKSRSI